MPTSPESASGPSRKIVLVVDDELAGAEVLALILQDEGYEVFCASNGAHGLQRAAELKPDLIIADFMMPVISGGEMARALRASEATRSVKIIMNSALSEQAVRKSFTGYDVYLRKPYNISQALEIIRTLLKDSDGG